jgi:hypothetical protein
MEVGGGVRNLRLDRDIPAGDMAGIEDPTDRIAAEDSSDLFLGGQLNQGGLKQTRADQGRSLGIDDDEGAGRVGLEVRGLSETRRADGCGGDEQERA